ncbi:WD40 repeat-like protein [Dacryopinax primogenitus]|uniref:Glutamate-rich WD repeat-containing protein 1 n=1 Tax=Dacryopinax primogenitus (strain DJM 731) TaxID=1858805 RepID=M5FWA1_DACPD|nr:WD40 repeat-like protein [Dacryopinax primogenitus]EJT99959.1 WD40 repeat-like protein [Dacryopinax primogenitus]
MGEFEDAWEDEEDDEDGEVVDAAEGEDDEDAEDEDAMEVDGPPEDEDEPPGDLDTYLPTRALEKDEILEPDQSVYEMLHRMNVTWPCLSFDVLNDGLGNERASYPQTVYLVAGTQADTARNNELMVMRMSSLHRTQRDQDDSDEEDDNDDVDEDAVLEYRSIPHMGGVNRVRAQPLPHDSALPPVGTPYFVSTWSETGKVHIFDVRPYIHALDEPGYVPDKSVASKPVYTNGVHKIEGFAMDWSPLPEQGPPRLLTGDMHSKIFLTTTTPSGFATGANAFTSHTSSVEDLQWSPGETTVFASCSADRTVRLWDVRVKNRQSVLCVDNAHEGDVNVISWNRGSQYLLASGGDEGGIKVWDLRNMKSKTSIPSPVASYTWHTAPITSLEWHPTEDSIFAASGADDQVTLWDLSVEQDDDEAAGVAGEGLKDVPPQLLFVHQGQRDIKEVHWCRQVPGAVVSTASDGFNVFKTISV